MNLYLDDENFKPEYLQIPLRIKSDAYYVKMGIAWFYATALTDQWEATLPIFDNPQLTPENHNKSIQKARESRKITPEQKELLNSLKIN